MVVTGLYLVHYDTYYKMQQILLPNTTLLLQNATVIAK